MNDLLTANDTLLEELLGHEAGCEAPHKDFDNLECSGPVTHRLSTACGVTKLICKATATRNYRLMQGVDASCGYCHCEYVGLCWTVTPA